MQTITLKNNYLMVKELVRDESQEQSAGGFIIPKETLDDEQVSQGTVVRTIDSEYSVGDVVLFHRVMPVDIHMKIDDDTELKTYFFIRKDDIICKLTD